MKYLKQIMILALPLTLLLGGCDSDTPVDVLSEASVAQPLSAQLRGIERYIEQNRKLTRSDGYRIIPYIENGDTLMYIADYGEGWELFSNSFTVPMSLMKSETGDFGNTMANANPAFKALFENMLEGLKNDKSQAYPDTLPGSEQWMAYSSNPNPVNPPSGDAVYTLVGMKEYPKEEIKVDHLIKTKWHQHSPLNAYMPYQAFKPTEHIYVGCNAVALGQLLYYSHFKWGLEIPVPTSATYNASENKYIFSDFRTNQFENMSWYYFWEGESVAPMLLGWIAQKINSKANYDKEEHTGTSAYFSNDADFITQEAGYPAEMVSYSDYGAVQMLAEGKPILLYLSNSKYAHTLIADAVDYSGGYVDYYYAYVTPGGGNGSTMPDPNPQPGPNTGTSSDYNYLVSLYGNVETEHRLVYTAYFKFNWGWGINEYDDSLEVNGRVFNLIFKKEDGSMENVPYRITYMIKYTIS